MEDIRQTKVRELLAHYFERAFKNAGAPWSESNDLEIAELAKAICEAPTPNIVLHQPTVAEVHNAGVYWKALRTPHFADALAHLETMGATQEVQILILYPRNPTGPGIPTGSQMFSRELHEVEYAVTEWALREKPKTLGAESAWTGHRAYLFLEPLW